MPSHHAGVAPRGYFVIEAVKRVDIDKFRANERGTDSTQ